MSKKKKQCKLKNWQKGALVGLLLSFAFVALFGLNMLNPEFLLELQNHTLPIWGFFAIMIIFYTPIFIFVGALIGMFIRKK